MKQLASILTLRSFGQTIASGDLAAQQRFRLFKITTVFAVAVFATMIYQFTMAPGKPVFIAALFVLFAGVFINYFLLTVHRRPAVAYFILMTSAFAVLHVVSYGQGGVKNSGLFYMAAVILTTFMLLGKNGGRLMTGLTIIHVIYFYIIGLYTSWVDYSLIGPDPRLVDLDFLITGVISLLLLSAQARYLEKSQNAITTDIKAKRDELAIKNAELLAVQKDLESKNKKFEQKNKELEQFAYVASHDLQEPLRTITGFIELFQQQYDGKLDDKADRYISYITQSSRRMRVLITDLLEYSRIGNKKQWQQVDCSIILSEVLADLDAAIGESGAMIGANPLPVITGYPTEIKSLFQNLISNSIKFRKKDIPPRISISAVQKDNAWQFCFADDGIGIAEEYHERIFVIFQRLHSRREYAGSGIGLAHCKKIVELHNGRIWLESELNKGTTFYFTISNNTHETEAKLYPGHR
jgi:signal transduction histidine kinase